MKMVYTVTLNPSLDYIITTDDFVWGKTNRTVTEEMIPGGKGINVSIVLSHLGIENTALGFVAGFVGEEISRQIGQMGLCSDFVKVKEGCSRINVKLKEYEGTEINGSGPVICEEELQQLWQRLDGLGADDVLVLAGSVPKGISGSLYREMLEKWSDRGSLFVVDAAGELLKQVLPYHPFLIKPNRQELGAFFDVEIESVEDVIPYAGMLQEMGARNVLVSMGGEGAVLLDEYRNVHRLEVPKGKPINAVGAGDSMVAGFLAGWMERQDYSHAFRLSVAAGSASTFSEQLASGAQIRTLYETWDADRQTGE